MNNSTIRREWNPCKICRYLDDGNFADKCEQCRNDIINDHSGFYPANDFQQFLKKNNYKIDESQIRFEFDVCPIIVLCDSLYAVNDNKNLFNEFYEINTTYYDLYINDAIEELKCSYKLNTINVLNGNKENRDALYACEFIMKHYLVYLLYNDSDKRKSLRYKLDDRFYHITY